MATDLLTNGLVLKVTIIDRNAKQTQGEVRVQTWDKKTRTKRALKTLGYCWLGAICAVPFPIVHLVLVPGLLIGGVVGAYLISSQESVVLGGKGTCPSCLAVLDIVRGPDKWPLSDMCAKCQGMVTIEKALDV